MSNRFAKADRKVFDYEGNPVMAAGILLWKRTEEGNLYFAISEPEKNRGYTEPGGKVEHSDKTPYEAAAREFAEEVGSPPPPYEMLQWTTTYFKHAKYLLFMARVPEAYEVKDQEVGKWVKYTPGSFFRIDRKSVV